MDAPIIEVDLEFGLIQGDPYFATYRPGRDEYDAQPEYIRITTMIGELENQLTVFMKDVRYILRTERLYEEPLSQQAPELDQAMRLAKE